MIKMKPNNGVALSPVVFILFMGVYDKYQPNVSGRGGKERENISAGTKLKNLND